MRFLALTFLAIGAISAAAPAEAQTYGRDYPVCMQVFGPANYFDCRFTSMPQCRASASGRAAECVVNPYLSGGDDELPAPQHHRRHRHAH